MPAEKALSILQKGVSDGKDDGNIVNALTSYLEKNGISIAWHMNKILKTVI
jgi:HD-GYP domain-containing protein (c-di-GMP phosphodiesterase class II)